MTHRPNSQSGLALRFYRTHSSITLLQRQFLNLASIPSSIQHTGQILTKLHSLVLNDTQSNKIATWTISQPGFNPWFQITHKPNLSQVTKDRQCNENATRQFLHSYNSTRTKSSIFKLTIDSTITKSSIFKLTIDSMLNQLAKISACHVSTRTQTTYRIQSRVSIN